MPLSRQALALLAAIRPTDADPSALVFPTSTGAALSNRDRETKRLHKLSGTAGWHRHDLRRTSATLLGETGTEPHIIEAALNHTAIHSRLAATYNRSRYRPQVADALQRLADALDGIEQGSAESLPVGGDGMSRAPRRLLPGTAIEPVEVFLDTHENLDDVVQALREEAARRDRPRSTN